MTDPSRASAATSDRPGLQDEVRRLVLPLWIAGLSLAVIAAVMIISSVELFHVLRSTQAAIAQLQQQLAQLESGLGGLLGG